MNLLAALLVAALAPAPTPVAPEYVALGDSYAAGVGAHRAECGRSDAAHPALFAAARGMELRFAACSGATTAEVATQAEQITPRTSLVTLTVGGNDAGFADVMTKCVLGGENSCRQRVEQAERFTRDELPARLDAVHAAIRARTSAPVVVLGYPRLFAPTGRCLLTEAQRAAVNRAADLLVDVVRTRAQAAGFRFGDVREPFEGHGACGPNPWVNDLSFPVADSFHPNGAGHRLGYLPVLERVTTGG
ncbi:SGNH/GDSL hydrolase family protein [Saccharothrix obliqua]|uniref:SGNH/GDSL hydrolase family protein n=1 Tax=Saccharothrix obliqua TaxID=2861747 RepID=UPI001C5D3BB3|nr:SGNH/GDSL hydrolase family protein [Saccharothrix obliqua]MBW4717451.1 SGNH/GDSL hydrolase family protein [Saccharothrix obliqua]